MRKNVLKTSFVLLLMLSFIVALFPVSMSVAAEEPAANPNALKGKTIVAYGDSITYGAKWSILENKFGCTVINKGVVGESTGSAVSRFDSTVPQYNPDIVTICYGLNDHAGATANGWYTSPSTYKNNLKKLGEKAKALGADVIFITTNPHKYPSCLNNSNFDKYGGAVAALDNLFLAGMRDVAMEGGYGLVDVRAEWEGLNWDNYLSSDKLHPNASGYTLAANTICKYLEAKYCDPASAKTLYVNYVDQTGAPAKNANKLTVAQGTKYWLYATDVNGYSNGNTLSHVDNYMFTVGADKQQSYTFNYNKASQDVTVTGEDARILINGIDVGFYGTGYNSESGYATIIRTTKLGGINKDAAFWIIISAKYDSSKLGYVVTAKYDEIGTSKTVSVASDEILLCVYNGNPNEAAKANAIKVGDILRASSDLNIAGASCKDGVSFLYVNGTATASSSGTGVSGIEVVATPDKTEYEEDEEVDTKGLVLKASYTNNLYKYVLDGFTVDADTSYPGTKDVTVTFGDKTATFQITVKGQPVPDKIKFKAGAGFTRETGSEFVNPAATGKTAGELKGAIANSTMEVYSGDTPVDDDAKLVTGMIVKIFVNGNATDTAIIVIKGDADCDGEISNTDYTLVKAFFKSSAPLDKAALAAADADGNGKVTVSDYIKIKRHNNGTINLFA